jgi:TonB family protein
VFLVRRRPANTTTPRDGRIYSAYEDGIVYFVVVYDQTGQPDSLDYLVSECKQRFFSSWEMKFENDVTMNTDDGKQYSIQKRGVDGALRFYVKPKHAYLAAVVGAKSGQPATVRFLNSFVMWAYSIDKMRGNDLSASGPNGTPQSGGRGLSDAGAARKTEAKRDPALDVLPGIKAIITPKSGVEASPSQNAAGDPDPATNRIQAFDASEVTKRALVVLKPEADYTEEARANQIEGVVKLSAVLSQTGSVTQISVLEGLPYGLSENAIRALRHLLFIPASKDDRRVSQTITIEYAFNLNEEPDH